MKMGYSARRRRSFVIVTEATQGERKSSMTARKEEPGATLSPSLRSTRLANVELLTPMRVCVFGNETTRKGNC